MEFVFLEKNNLRLHWQAEIRLRDKDPSTYSSLKSLHADSHAYRKFWKWDKICYTLSDHWCIEPSILLVPVLQRKAKQSPCDIHTVVSFVSTVCLSAGKFFTALNIT